MYPAHRVGRNKLRSSGNATVNTGTCRNCAGLVPAYLIPVWDPARKTFHTPAHGVCRIQSLWPAAAAILAAGALHDAALFGRQAVLALAVDLREDAIDLVVGH